MSSIQQNAFMRREISKVSSNQSRTWDRSDVVVGKMESFAAHSGELEGQGVPRRN